MSAHTYITAQNWFQVITLAKVPTENAQTVLPDLITIAQASQLPGNFWRNFQIVSNPTHNPQYILDEQDEQT